MRLIKWLAVGTMFAVGIGAVFVSTIGLGGTQAATTEFLTQAALRTDVARTSAATGIVATAETYGLAFGETARLSSGTTSTSTADSDWLVAAVSVAVGDRVVQGQVLATASTADIEQQLTTATADLELARMRTTEAERTLKDARTEARRGLVDAKTAVTAAELALKSAKVTRADAADGNPTRQAKISVIQTTDRLREARRVRDDLKDALAGDFPNEGIAVAEASQVVSDLEMQIADLEEQLDLAAIVAPIAGVVAAINIEPGFVAPSDDAIKIDSSTLEVIADVVESDISALDLGQTAMISIDALDIEVPGTVTSIAPSTEGGNSSVVTFPVTVTIIEPDPLIKSGMSSDVEITIAQAPAVVAVPAVALQGRDGAYTVRVADANGGVEARQVTVGLVNETLAEIQSGVFEGESVVVGTNTARDVSVDEQAAGFGGAGAAGFGGGFRGLQGGGGGRRGGGN